MQKFYHQDPSHHQLMMQQEQVQQNVEKHHQSQDLPLEQRTPHYR